MFEVRVIPGASRLSLELKRSALVSPTDPTEKVRVWVARRQEDAFDHFLFSPRLG